MPLDLTILTPTREAFRGPVASVVLPGSEGDFGVLESHERFLAPLRVGVVEIRTGSRSLVAAIAEGFAEVSGDDVRVLVESCELAHEIDVARAELARERAEQGLARFDREEDALRYAAYEAAIGRARNRIDVSRGSGSGTP